MTDRQKIRNQAEAILDTHHSRRLEVIVQMMPDRPQRRALRRAASEAISRRRFSLSPRDLLPERLGRKPRPNMRRASSHAWLGNRGAGVTISNVAEHPGVTGPAGLQSLWSHEVVRKSFEATSTDVHVDPRVQLTRSGLLAAKALLLRIGRDDLHKLVNDVDGIHSVHINRQLQTPTTMEVRPLMEETEDTLGSTWGLLKSNAIAAWGRYGARGNGVKVGILDTGVDALHPDLNGKVSAFAEFNSLGQVIGTNPRDSGQHGTHCAGTIVGGDSSKRAIGMAPEAKLAAALVLNGTNGGTDAQVLAGIDWALDQGVDVISMSLGGLTMDAETPPTYTEAILSCLDRGVPVVTAIGNEGHQTTGSPGNDLFALSIGATDSANRAAGFSGGRTQIIYDNEHIDPTHLPLPYTKPDLSAPGVAVTSAVPGDTWKTLSGTSMAAPHVAGAIAQLLSATAIRDLTDGQGRAFLIHDLIIGAAEDCGESGQDQRFGFGRLDVLRAIDYAIERGYRQTP